MCKKCKISKTFWVVIIAGLVVLALWAGSWWWISQHFQNLNERGTFGDMFGAINALFSGLAFAGLIVTLLYQKEELTLQREELKATREEMKSQRMEFEVQNKTLKRQRFENTFFNMLSLQQEIVANLSYAQHNGREIFEEAYIKNIRFSLIREGHKNFSRLPLTTIFDHYFTHLYHIFKYIHTSPLIEDDERYEYASIARAQLSRCELTMIFYYCLTADECEKFKPLIEKYAIFHNLRPELLAKKDDKLLYADTAFNREAK